MVEHPAMPRRRRVARLLCLLSVCAVGSDAIYVESDPAAEVPEYCTLYHHQVRKLSRSAVSP